MNNRILSGLSAVAGATAGAAANRYYMNREWEKQQERYEKFKNYFDVLNQWMTLREEGRSVVSYFEKYNIRTIAVYGMGKLGNHLLWELQDSPIKVVYGIDKNNKVLPSGLSVYAKNDDLPPVDAVVVSATFDYDAIEMDLCCRTDMLILSLEAIVMECE
jgi:hypothetical protein